MSAHRYAFEALPCGAVRLLVAQATVVCRPSGALWFEASRTLIVADLHLEKGSAFAARGQLLPPYDTRETLNRLDAEIAALTPRVLVFLGDSFHDGDGEARLAPDDHARVSGLAVGRDLVWVVGNHDADGPRALPGEVVADLALEGLALTHEPLAGAAPGQIAGHLHPCVRVRARGASTRRRCFATDGERLILPAFGAYAGGLNLTDPAFTPLFRRPPLAVVLGRGRAHAVGWGSLVPD